MKRVQATKPVFRDSDSNCIVVTKHGRISVGLIINEKVSWLDTSNSSKAMIVEHRAAYFLRFGEV